MDKQRNGESSGEAPVVEDLEAIELIDLEAPEIIDLRFVEEDDDVVILKFIPSGLSPELIIISDHENVNQKDMVGNQNKEEHKRPADTSVHKESISGRTPLQQDPIAIDPDDFDKESVSTITPVSLEQGSVHQQVQPQTETIILSYLDIKRENELTDTSVPVVAEDEEKQIASSSKSSPLKHVDIDAFANEQDEIVTLLANLKIEQEENKFMESKLVYLPRPDFSSFSLEERKILRKRVLRRLMSILPKCKFGKDDYKRKHKPFPKENEDNPFPTNIIMVDSEGVERQIIFRHAEWREKDEKDATPGYQLPNLPTQSFYDMLNEHLPQLPQKKLRNICKSCRTKEQSTETVSGTAAKPNLQEPRPGTSRSFMKFQKLYHAEAVKQQVQDQMDTFILEKGSDIPGFCQKFRDVVAKREAEQQARIKEKEEKKAASLARLNLRPENRPQTRLATGALQPKRFFRVTGSVPHSPAPLVVAEKRQKRKINEEPSCYIGDEGKTLNVHCYLASSTLTQHAKDKLVMPLPPLAPTLNTKRKTSSQKESTAAATPNSPNSKRGSSSQAKKSSIANAVIENKNALAATSASACPVESDAGRVQGDEWGVEKIIDAKIMEGGNLYKVKWEGWTSYYNEWVHETNIMSDEPMEEYWRKITQQIQPLNAPTIL